ncbi:site-specific integrase [Candidatus Woesearchaeota archaeon]|nr:site-specific integrase [Candidatus Woesearchaeota archaeon]
MEPEFNSSTNALIEEINILLSKKRLFQKEIYENLIAQGMMKPNTEKEFKKLYEWAISQKLIDQTKVRNWNKKKGKLPHYFTKAQLIKIFDAIDRPKDGIACFLALMCGLRVREVCWLKIKDIDFEDQKIFIRNSKNPNRSRQGYGKDRIVRFDKAIEGALRKWIDIIGDSSEWFLPSDKSPDTHLRPKSLHERFRSYLKQSNLLEVDYVLNIRQRVNGEYRDKKVHRHKFYFHCLRHTMASIIYNKTGDIYAVKEFLGHEQVDTTTVYAKMTESKMRGVIASVFSSLHYNYSNGEHHPLPQRIVPGVKSQPVVQTEANSPMQLLEIQFVNGDIGEVEFLRKKQILESNSITRTIELKGDFQT